jgi:Cyclic nucleotide-binding domain
LIPRRFWAAPGVGITVERFQKNQEIFVRGEAADTVCYLQKGQVKAIVLSDRGKEAIVGIFQKGQFFGEGCLDDGAKFPGIAGGLIAGALIGGLASNAYGYGPGYGYYGGYAPGYYGGYAPAYYGGYPSCLFIPISEANGASKANPYRARVAYLSRPIKTCKFLRASRNVKTSRRTGGVGRNNRREMTNAGFDL